MHEIRHEIEVAASADAAWTVVGDVGSTAEWLPALAESRMEGMVRYGTMHDGSEAVERVIHYSNDARTYSYVIVKAPIPLREYESTIKVEEVGNGSRIVWTARFESDEDLRSAVDGMYENGLNSLALLLNGSTKEN